MSVTIYRDSYGAPHIYAESEPEALYGVGYAQAQDRLGTMMKTYRQSYGALSHEIRTGIESFLTGVRMYMHDYPERVPTWAVDPQPFHVIALSRFIIWGWLIGQAMQKLERRPEPEDTGQGSNQWVIGRRLSEQDCVIACIDPHLGISDEWSFFECHVHGGDYNALLFNPPGLPYAGLGHNDYCSWSMTTGGPDTVDVYEEEIHNEDSTKYRYDDEWRDIEIEKATIDVQTDTGIKKVDREIHFTHHGPIVLREGNKAFAVKTRFPETHLKLSGWGFINMRIWYKLSILRRALCRTAIFHPEQCSLTAP